ncbi:TadE/TadG family type IV pilus assembly protein [Ruegeria sp.]|uniref:TadE/TadG family type IV pilus assembly protein n=1 Tax=Ruegeria sp. TaxID=1879320 RepID=UPI003B5B276F
MKRVFAYLTRFKRCESGAPMVEFAMVLPLLLVFFALIIEGGRLTWIHQATAAGVRDASRMIARIAPIDACTSGGVGGYSTMATNIVQNRLGGSSIMPVGSTLINVTPTCISRTGTYRVSPASVVEVSAEVRIDYVFGNIFSFFGSGFTSLNTVVSDQSRIFGV